MYYIIMKYQTALMYHYIDACITDNYDEHYVLITQLWCTVDITHIYCNMDFTDNCDSLGYQSDDIHIPLSSYKLHADYNEKRKCISFFPQYVS